jgi:GNAT superfamily N-acetyltransferase
MSARGDWRGVLLPREPQRPDALVEACPLGAQQPCGRRHVPIGFVERPPDPIPLSRVAHVLQSTGGRLRCLPELHRDRRGGDTPPGRENRHPLDNIAQLTDVARPVMTLEHGEDVGVEVSGSKVVAGAELGEEVGGQLAHVVEPLAQRRHADWHDAQAVEEILAEPALGDQRVEAAIGRRHDSHRHADGLLAADALELAVLQDAQQLGLGGLVQVADLVEEDRAAVGQLELAAPQRNRARERPLLVAEELAFDEVGGNGSAVHLHERTRGERALAVDVRGQQLLAGP